jgi:soluble lytic murein transglycosylase
MFRLVRNVVALVVFSALAAAAVILLRSSDWVYQVQEWLNHDSFRTYNAVIERVAKKQGVDPLLIKAVIWRESAFDPNKIGRNGERGLMQLSELAAREWAAEKRVENFQLEELFDPKTNLEAGSWYLHRAVLHWKERRDPVPFALAEYNAGPSRAQRWAGGGSKEPISAKAFQENIDFPGTKNYVHAIIERYRFYQRRGRM